MLFKLGDVVGHVVDLEQVEVPHLAGQDPLEGLAHAHRQHLPVDEGVVDRARHRAVVCPALGGVDGSADQLPGRQLQPVFLHRRLQSFHVVIAHLVAETTRAAVDLYHHLTLPQAERFRYLRIVHLFDDVYLQEVIPTTQRTHLRKAPLLGASAHRAGIGAGQAALLLRVVQILLPRQPPFQRPLRTLCHQFVQLSLGDAHASFPTHAAGAGLV